MSEGEEKSKAAEKWWPFLLILGASTAAWALWGFVYAPWVVAKLQDPMARAGQFGDLFGGVNALFTAFAFAAVWWTGWMQRAELKLQRRELQLQREELADTRAVFSRQNFESNFFRLLQLVRDITDSTQFKGSSGSEAINRIAITVKAYLRSAPHGDEDYLRHAMEKYLALYDEVESHLGPLFRTLYQLFVTVDQQAGLILVERRYYAKLARAQLGADVLTLIAINALSPRSNSFVPLIAKYGVLKHFPSDPALGRLRTLLPAEAFMSSEDRIAAGVELS